MLDNKNSQTKFNFKDFKTQKWDIEHIHPQNENIESRFVEWLRMQLIYGQNNEQVKKILDKKGGFEDIKKKAVNTKIKDKDFKETIEQYFGVGQVESTIQDIYKNVTIDNPKEIICDIDSIKNLTLLDIGTNRSYKNAFFPTKRNCVIELDKTSTFIPLCTRNVFVKYYSKNNDKPYIWSENDANDYLDAIKDTLKEYIGENND